MPLLPLTEGLVKTSHFDDEMRQLADRHYSRRTPGARQFAYAGRKLVLRDAAGTVLFVWMWPYPEMRMDGQLGYNCSIFRNESERRSSEIILEAEAAAFAKWGPGRYPQVYADTDGPEHIKIQHIGTAEGFGLALMTLTRRDARLLAKRLNQCLDETRS